jgi:hypothetical protein
MSSPPSLSQLQAMRKAEQDAAIALVQQQLAAQNKRKADEQLLRMRAQLESSRYSIPASIPGRR